MTAISASACSIETPGCEPRDDAEVALIARAVPRVRLERQPELGEFRKREARRHDADHGVRDAVHANRLADDALGRAP